MTKLTKYKKLLSKSYVEVIEVLHKKYGKVKKDYFGKESYNNFLEGSNCQPNRPNNTGAPEGLYCHHIYEIEYTNLSDPDTIKREEYPFYLQEKNRLVYCDLFEHAILHVLIAKETVFKYGFVGYKDRILIDIENWYLNEKEPIKSWEKNCYEKAYLKPKEACRMVKLMFKELNEEFSRYQSKYLKEKIDDYEYVEKNLKHGPLFRK